MRQFGLIGHPLSHSFSPGYFKQKFIEHGIKDCRYDLFPLVNLDEVRELMSLVSGLNVTIPYKQDIIPFLDELSAEAREIGAVNCIKNVDGKFIGYNTDYFGFKESLLSFMGGATSGVRALVLGQGGASLAIKAALHDLDIEYLPISRSSPYKTYDELTSEDITTHHLIINTTPLGMSPYIDQCPDISYKDISTQHFLYDVVYNPEKTLFLTHGIKMGAKTKNGMEMLRLQADKTWEIWNQAVN